MYFPLAVSSWFDVEPESCFFVVGGGLFLFWRDHSFASWYISDNAYYFYCFSEPFAYVFVAGLWTSLMAQIGTQGDASSHQGQTEQCLQRQPGEIKQRPHAGTIQLHKGILQWEGEERKSTLERQGRRNARWQGERHLKCLGPFRRVRGKGQTHFGGNDFRPTLFTFIQEIFFETLLVYQTP